MIASPFWLKGVIRVHWRFACSYSAILILRFVVPALAGSCRGNRLKPGLQTSNENCWLIMQSPCLSERAGPDSPRAMGHVKLHIPGPVEVSETTFRAFCTPMIGHRGQGFKDLYAKMQPQLQQLLSAGQLVFISTSSAWGVMEGALRNLVSKKVLNCMCGAFSDKWFEVSKRCGKEAEALQVSWGSPDRAEVVDQKLATGQFDALTLIHNETSTGVMSPLAEIAALKTKYPDVMFVVDSVSSLSATITS